MSSSCLVKVQLGAGSKQQTATQGAASCGRQIRKCASPRTQACSPGSMLGAYSTLHNTNAHTQPTCVGSMVLLARRLASTKASDSSNESCARMEAYRKEDSSGSEEASC